MAILKTIIAKYSIDVVILQEIWTPQEEMKIYNFRPPIIRLRGSNQYGGVAILVNDKCKVVHKTEFDQRGLEAVWTEVN